jgi:RNA polymerase sigma-70 factor (ECF subfamily)
LVGLQRFAAEGHRRVVTSEELSDTDLLVLSRTRPEMLGVVYERHASAVYRYLRRRVGVGASEDLLGEVFVAAVAARLRVRPHDSGSALPWLYGIAGNVVRSYRRRSLGRIPVDEVTAVDWDAVDERLDAGTRRQELRVALAGLTEAEREVLLLVAWEGLSPSEAARALGLTAVAARSRLHRARARAQATLGDMTPAGL